MFGDQPISVLGLLFYLFTCFSHTIDRLLFVSIEFATYIICSENLGVQLEKRSVGYLLSYHRWASIVGSMCAIYAVEFGCYL